MNECLFTHYFHREKAKKSGDGGVVWRGANKYGTLCYGEFIFHSKCHLFTTPNSLSNSNSPLLATPPPK